MEQPVICPHCNKFFVAELESGNPFCLCPKCGRWMNVGALVKKGERPQPSGPLRCPYCQAEMSPGNDTCPKCQREIATGKMLPLSQRLRMLPIGTKLLALCAALALLVVVVVGINLAVTVLTKPEPGPPAPPPPTESPEVKTAQEILARLLKADDPAEAFEIGEELGRVGAPATEVILRALDRKDLTLAVQRGLIHALGGACRNAPNVAASDRLDALLNHPELGRTALISLAWMGDARAARRIEQIFAETFLHKEMGDALVRMNQLDDDIDPVGLQRVWSDRVRALRGPMAALGHHGLVRMLARYWPAWDWPMRDRGRAWMDEVNQVAGQIVMRPGFPEMRSVNAELVQLLSGAKPGVRLAAALLLHKRSAGGRSDREGWARALNDLLSHKDRTIRERTVWTLATITGKTFGRYGPDQPPTRVSPLALKEAAAWLGNLFGKPLRISPALLAEHETRRRTERRTYHPARVEARQLVAGLPDADWPAARKAWKGLRRLPADAAPVVRRLLDGDVRRLSVPARLVVLQSLAWWRDRASVPKMAQISGLLDNPVWMSACLAAAKASASRETESTPWQDKVASLSPDILTGRDPSRGFVPNDLAVLIAPQGRSALRALQSDSQYGNENSPLYLVRIKTIDAMTEYGWPTSAWR